MWPPRGVRTPRRRSACSRETAGSGAAHQTNAATFLARARHGHARPASRRTRPHAARPLAIPVEPFRGFAGRRQPRAAVTGGRQASFHREQAAVQLHSRDPRTIPDPGRCVRSRCLSHGCRGHRPTRRACRQTPPLRCLEDLPENHPTPRSSLEGSERSQTAATCWEAARCRTQHAGVDSAHGRPTTGRPANSPPRSDLEQCDGKAGGRATMWKTGGGCLGRRWQAAAG